MKKISVLALVFTVSTAVLAQKSNVQNAFRAKEKGNIAEAIEYIEKAAANSSTANDVKMHNYRGEIYFEVHSNVEHAHLDAMAALKCAESWEAVAKHPKAKKWFDKDGINSKVTKAGVALFNKGVELHSAGNHQAALNLYNKIFDLIPLDEGGNLSRSNVTKESVWFNSFFVTYDMKDYTLGKDYLQKLIDIAYQEPKIYSFMASMYQEEGNLDKALEYIQLGREMFEFNVDLIIAELNYYLGSGDFTKAEELLNLAIKEDPNNHQLFFALGSSYDNLDQFDKAVSAYEEAVAIKPDFFDALYNLGVLYYNKGGDMIKEANNMSDWRKADAHTKKAEETMLKALPHIETCYNLDANDKNILLILKELYYRNGNTDKYQEVSSKLK